MTGSGWGQWGPQGPTAEAALDSAGVTTYGPAFASPPGALVPVPTNSNFPPPPVHDTLILLLFQTAVYHQHILQLLAQTLSASPVVPFASPSLPSPVSPPSSFSPFSPQPQTAAPVAPVQTAPTSPLLPWPYPTVPIDPPAGARSYAAAVSSSHSAPVRRHAAPLSAPSRNDAEHRLKSRRRSPKSQPLYHQPTYAATELLPGATDRSMATSVEAHASEPKHGVQNVHISRSSSIPAPTLSATSPRRHVQRALFSKATSLPAPPRTSPPPSPRPALTRSSPPSPRLAPTRSSPSSPRPVRSPSLSTRRSATPPPQQTQSQSLYHKIDSQPKAVPGVTEICNGSSEAAAMEPDSEQQASSSDDFIPVVNKKKDRQHLKKLLKQSMAQSILESEEAAALSVVAESPTVPPLPLSPSLRPSEDVIASFSVEAPLTSSSVPPSIPVRPCANCKLSFPSSTVG
jgi:hypothetical protein